MPDRVIVHSLEDLAPRARQVVDDLHHGLVDLFEDDLAAVWLYGASLFTPHALDIDLHVLLRNEPSGAEDAAIRSIQSSISGNLPFEDELDAWYILQDDAMLSQPPRNVGAWNRGIVDEHWALHRAHWLAGACLVVDGLDPCEVVLEPAWPELEAALRKEASDPAASTAASPYWTLQLCRVLASLETRDVVRSKLGSGEWALERLPAAGHAAVRAAMRAYSPGATPDAFSLDRDDYAAFYDCIRPLLDAALTAA